MSKVDLSASYPTIINDKVTVTNAAGRLILTDQGHIFDATYEQIYALFHSKNGGWNALYLDGHVSWVPRTKVPRKLPGTINGYPYNFTMALNKHY